MVDTANRGPVYTWEEGDTFALITTKYRQPQARYIELLDINKPLLQKNNYIMRAGDQIDIPEDWFPLPSVVFGTKFVGSKGERIK